MEKSEQQIIVEQRTFEEKEYKNIGNIFNNIILGRYATYLTIEQYNKLISLYRNFFNSFFLLKTNLGGELGVTYLTKQTNNIVSEIDKIIKKIDKSEKRGTSVSNFDESDIDRLRTIGLLTNSEEDFKRESYISLSLLISKLCCYLLEEQYFWQKANIKLCINRDFTFNSDVNDLNGNFEHEENLEREIFSCIQKAINSLSGYISISELLGIIENLKEFQEHLYQNKINLGKRVCEVDKGGLIEETWSIEHSVKNIVSLLKNYSQEKRNKLIDMNILSNEGILRGTVKPTLDPRRSRTIIIQNKQEAVAKSELEIHVQYLLLSINEYYLTLLERLEKANIDNIISKGLDSVICFD